MSIRTQQIESTLQRAISEVVAKRLGDPRIAGLISITRVQVSPDLHNAYVYISVLPERHEKTSLHGLQSASRRIHALLRKAVRLRAIPQLEFRLDKSIKKEADVLDAIRQAVEREGPRSENDNTPTPPEDTPPEDQPR